MHRTILTLLLCSIPLLAKSPLLVISVDGLDHRYLADRDRLGLKIPNIRKMLAQGSWADRGVIGVVPTITWPSHTTLITGVEPSVHGITSNRLPGGDYPWSVHSLRAETLVDAAHAAGLKSAAITWPVTVDAPLDYNLPEYFSRRRGGAMDLQSVESKSVPSDLVAQISRASPSFAQEWMDDRTRAEAATFLLRKTKPDLLLIHLVDLDSEEHDNGPFTRQAFAVLEYTDELIGRMLAAKSPDTAVALVSDHGFERVDTTVDLLRLAAKQHVAGLNPRGAIVTARDGSGVVFLERLASEGRFGVGRRIPPEEVARLAPGLTKEAAVFESAEHFEFAGTGAGSQIFGKPHEIGTHGHWPTRYRAVFVIAGDSLPARRLGEIPMTQVAPQFAQVLGIVFTPGPRAH